MSCTSRVKERINSSLRGAEERISLLPGAEKERINSLLRERVVGPRPTIKGVRINRSGPDTQNIIIWPNLMVCLYFFRCECTVTTSFPASFSSLRASTDRESPHSSVYSNSGCD